MRMPIYVCNEVGANRRYSPCRRLGRAVGVSAPSLKALEYTLTALWVTPNSSLVRRVDGIREGRKKGNYTPAAISHKKVVPWFVWTVESKPFS